MVIIPFAQITEEHLPTVGSKAYSLGKLTQAKFSVPEGFVVSSEAFTFFLKESDIGVTIQSELAKVSLDDLHSVDYASRLISDLIRSAKMPEELLTVILQQFAHIPSDYVAVRSSAFSQDHQIAWSGELESFLNVSFSDIPQKIQACWASLFSTRSLYYFLQQELNIETANIAIVVQNMIDADASGIAYSAHPVTQDHNQVVIEAEKGLGDVTEKGEITPDTYVIDIASEKIIDKNIHNQTVAIESSQEGTLPRELSESEGTKQKLPDEQILQLAKKAKEIERAFGHPVDLEWAYKEEFFFLQARELKV